MIEVSSGEAGCAKDAEDRRPIASTTKLMTALLALERLKLGAKLQTSSYRPSAGESVIGLLPGERLTVRDLLHGLLVFSGNDAAMALASGVAGSEGAFVRLMNRRARQLGLTETHYENPIGLDAPGNYSSAHDLVRLATVLRTNPFFRTVVDSPQVTLHSGSHVRRFLNRNDARPPLLVGQRRQDRPHAPRGLRARRLGQAPRRAGRLRGARHARRGRARRAVDRAAADGPRRVPGRRPRCARAGTSRGRPRCRSATGRARGCALVVGPNDVQHDRAPRPSRRSSSCARSTCPSR